MLKRDYLLKLIQDLFSAISRILEGEGDATEKQREIESLYQLFGADKDFFRSAYLDDTVATVAKVVADSEGVTPDRVSPSDLSQRLELLGNLLFADFKISDLSSGLKADVANRALALLSKVDETSDTYSFDRLSKIEEIKTYLASAH